jgi:hypothetical protein
MDVGDARGGDQIGHTALAFTKAAQDQQALWIGQPLEKGRSRRRPLRQKGDAVIHGYGMFYNSYFHNIIKT